MKSLTICYVTARKEPKLEWFLDSLNNQLSEEDSYQVHIIIVDFHALQKSIGDRIHKVKMCTVDHSTPKPNVWQGPCKLTKGEWWATSAYRNTGLCMSDRAWIAWVDDRSVLMPTWLSAVQDAMKGNYAVAGAYQKRSGMEVTDGVITTPGTIIGEDPRSNGTNKPRTMTRFGNGGGCWFGCTNALPVEWALEINGWDESADSLGLEDCIFGNMLAANGRPIKYDPRMMIVEDRTPTLCDSAVQRTDKGKSPKDKSHSLLDRTRGKKQATHHWNLREIREKVLRGEPFPIPDQPTHDWYDGQSLSEFP